MFGVFVSLFLLVAAGAVFRLVKGAQAADAVRHSVGSAVLMVFLPALTFDVLSQSVIDAGLLIAPGIAVIVTSCCALLAWLVCRKIPGLNAPAVGALILAAAWPNVTYLGLPVVSNVVGEHVQRIPILYDLLGVTPLLFTLGVVICVEFGSRGPRHTLTEGLRQAATTPPMIAAIAGLLVNLSGLTIPSVIITAVHSAGQVVAPLMLFSIGLALRAPNTRALYALAPSLIIKLVAAPLLGVALTALTLATAASDADADVLRAIRLESAMPTMVLTMVFAERYGLDEELLAQAILISTVLSMLTLPVVAGW